MSKTIPMIQKYMTTTPYSINAEDNLETAMNLMKEHSIRHLPVLKSGTLVGILTDRDLKLALGVSGTHPTKTLAGEIAVEDVYITDPEAPLDQVVHRMAEKKIGSALVVQNHKLVGIFTSTDAMRILGDTLHMLKQRA